MKRTTTRHRREIARFLADNRRLFPFVGLLLVGVVAGVTVYPAVNPPESWLALTPVGEGFAGWGQALWSSAFSTITMLTALYLLGLWGCGAPFILAVPLFYGLGLGLTEAHYYARGPQGVLTVALLLLPVSLLTGTLLTAAGVQSLRLSLRLSRQLLPGGEGNLWNSFRLYSLRFLLFLAGAVVVGLTDVLLRALWPQLL